MSTTLEDYAAPNPISRNRSGVIGRAVDRYEGPLKVSGTAPYAYEVETPAPPVYGVVIGAEIATGQVSGVDDAAARASPGVQLVWHAFNPPPGQAEKGARSYVGSQAAAKPVFATPEIAFFGQPVAFVAADTLENAQAAADLIRVRYDATPGAFVFDPAKAEPVPNDEARTGDFEKAFDAAAFQLDLTYTTPIQNHCQMEPCATTAWWNGEELVVHTSVQMLKPPQHLLAETLQIHRSKVHVLSRYIGGGFGGKGSTYEDLELAALAARDLQQPVKIALTRQQMFLATVHRPATVQRVRLGADRDGRLLGIRAAGRPPTAPSTRRSSSGPPTSRARSTPPRTGSPATSSIASTSRSPAPCGRPARRRACSASSAQWTSSPSSSASIRSSCVYGTSRTPTPRPAPRTRRGSWSSA